MTWEASTATWEAPATLLAVENGPEGVNNAVWGALRLPHPFSEGPGGGLGDGGNGGSVAGSGGSVADPLVGLPGRCAALSGWSAAMIR